MKTQDARAKLATLLIIQAVNEAREPFCIFGPGVVMDAAFLDVAGGALVSGMTRDEFMARCGKEWDRVVGDRGPEELAEYAARRRRRERTDG
jgi:hypothetical protein